MDLREEALKEPEVAAGDAFDGGDGLRVGEVVGVERLAELAPLTFVFVTSAALARRAGVLARNGGVVPIGGGRWRETDVVLR